MPHVQPAPSESDEAGRFAAEGDDYIASRRATAACYDIGFAGGGGSVSGMYS